MTFQNAAFSSKAPRTHYRFRSVFPFHTKMLECVDTRSSFAVIVICACACCPPFWISFFRGDWILVHVINFDRVTLKSSVFAVITNAMRIRNNAFSCLHCGERFQIYPFSMKTIGQIASLCMRFQIKTH